MSVGFSVGQYQGGRTSQSCLRIRLTAVPDWIERRFWGPGQILYIQPPLYYRYQFTRDGETWTGNWVGMNGDSLLIPDPREGNNWDDDLEVVVEPGVTYDITFSPALVS